MRCFVAIDVDEKLKPKIVEIQKDIIKFGNIKLVEKQNLHFTLRFLGEIGEKAVNDVKTNLEDIAKKTKPFEVTIRGIGAFPSLDYIRVVWLGADELYEIQKNLFNDKQAKPHLTIARVKSKIPELRNYIEHHKNIEIGKMLINNIKLKQSMLKPTGPIYTDIKTFYLRG